MNMTHEVIKIFFAGCSMLYYIIQLSLIGVWRKSILKKAGDVVYKNSPNKKIAGITVLVLCPLLIIFSLITKATFFVCCLMSIVAALACFINCREIVYGKINGVYTKGIIGGGRFSKYEDIQSFPDTSWKEPEKQEKISLTVQLLKQKSKSPQVYIIEYPSILEYVKVVNAIKSIKQNK